MRVSRLVSREEKTIWKNEKNKHVSHAHSVSSGASSRIQYTPGGAECRRCVYLLLCRVYVPRLRGTTAWRTCPAHNWSSTTAAAVHFPETIPPPPSRRKATYDMRCARDTIGGSNVLLSTTTTGATTDVTSLPFSTHRESRITRHRPTLQSPAGRWTLP